MNGLRKYWFPVTVILAAAVQGFASELARGAMPGPRQFPSPAPDTVIYDNSSIYTRFRDSREAEDESLFILGEEEVGALTARDTLRAPDSLRLTDPFRYRYYAALLDSLAHRFTVDSLKAAGDSLIWPKIDSIYFADSTSRAKEEFRLWYASLSKEERKKYDFEQKIALKMKLKDSVLAARDSLKAIRDSIAENKPRVLDTYAVPDSMQFKRIITWNVDPMFGNVRLQKLDTGYNYRFNELRFAREDVNASYLGISGSPVQYYDFTRRKSEEGVSFYAPYESYSYSPHTVPMYNTKTPYTELAYWGTLFANVEREEQNIHILTTQNIYPSLNFTLNYDRTGANGMLDREKVNNRSFFATVNYLGKRYSAHGGYIFNSVRKAENGGIVDNRWVTDTLVGSREIDVHLKNADNVLKKNTVFLNQMLRIPFRGLGRKNADSLGTHSDVTTAFIGHDSEYSVYTKHYTDKIGLGDENGRTFYGNNFFINPTASSDSLRVMKLENKLYLKLQPWSADAAVSSISAGIGNRILSHYMFTPDGYLNRPQNTVWNSLYVYGGAEGRIRKYVDWDARGYYTFAGNEINDFGLSADARFNIFPFRRHRNSPMSFGFHFETTLDEPEFFEKNYYSNHLKWSSDFAKKSTSVLEGTIDVPHWDFRLTAAYTQLFNNIYYDTQAVAQQNASPMSVAKLALDKNFRLWRFHLDNRALLQYSSDPSVVPLPTLALNLRWYLQLDVVKNVMQMQIGANALYTTLWHAPAYSPESGLFHNQEQVSYGNCPYIDAFVNIQWKRACIFVKLVNANMGWPNDRTDYFSAHGYIRSQRAVKFGVWWPFYLQSTRQGTANAGSSGGNASIGGPSGGAASGRQRATR